MTKDEFFNKLQLVTPHPKPGKADLCQLCRWCDDKRCVANEPDLIVESLDGTPEAVIRSQMCSQFTQI